MDFAKDVAIVAGIGAVPTILDVVCRTTGMGFAAVARVTEERWIACSVRDLIEFGLEAGGELKVETTNCNEIRGHRAPVVIDDVSSDPIYRGHPTAAMYGFRSYISMPIVLPGGEFFGTLCAIDPKPARVSDPGVVGMFQLFAELIAFHLDAHYRLSESAVQLDGERHEAVLREQFIAVLGHDLRNPLAAIQAGGDILARETLSERGRKVLDLLRRSTERMGGLIDDVLDFARGRLAGGLPMSLANAVDIAPLLATIVDEVRAANPDRVFETEIAAPGRLRCDPTRIGQLLSNLVANAVTHGTADSPIRIRAARDAEAFSLSVSNAGRPIPPEIAAHLFEPFVRDAAPVSKGLGLGLYIASEVAKAHGGTLAVTSTPEETRFSFSMPVEPAGV